jgi:DNA-binding response OmpR family regulator
MEAQRSRQALRPEKRERRVAGQPHARQSSEVSLQGKRVLVAEDDESARRAIALALRAMGLDVVETGDGGTMLAAVTSHYKDGRTPEDLDLIVTDVHMPVLDGLEVFRCVRAAHWVTPTIIVTGDDAPDVRRMAARLGAIVLSKPLDLDALEAAVRDLLAPRQPSRPPVALT